MRLVAFEKISQQHIHLSKWCIEEKEQNHSWHGSKLAGRGRVSKVLWTEGVNWSINIVNRSPTFSLRYVTPQQACSERRPVVDHFRIFGCIYYVHVPDVKWKKINDKDVKCVFLGVSKASKAYKCFNPLTKGLWLVEIIVLHEGNTWNWVENLSNQILCDDKSEEIAPANIAPTIEDFPPAQEPIETEQVVTQV